jgi:ATP-binding cassette, subfamily F, member 3
VRPATNGATGRPSKNQLARRERLEEQIAAAESALAGLEDELADPAAWSGAEASARSAARHEEAKRAVEQLYARYETLAG